MSTADDENTTETPAIIPLARPTLGEREAAAAREAILSGWVTQGPRVAAFEAAFARAVGAQQACAVANCTAALHLALLAVGVKPGDAVVTVSHSFVATANAVRFCGAEPLFVDIEPQSLCMSPASLERLLGEDCEERDGGFHFRHAAELATGESPWRQLADDGLGRVAALLPVHQLGMPLDLTPILALAKRYGLPVVEDAACAVGSQWRPEASADWERLGRPHGDIACFSFHPRKVLTTGDGGMITTNDEALDAHCRSLRSHAMDVQASERHGAHDVPPERFLTTAYNYRLTDIQAAIGLEQLGRLDGILAARRQRDAWYRAALGDLAWLTLPVEPDHARSNWQSYAVSLADDAPCHRDQLVRQLRESGVSARPGIVNIHTQPPYENGHFELPQSEQALERVVLLPLYDELTEADVERVAQAVRAVGKG